ncbi:MAG: sulfatase [Sedimentisphaerales bacterium]|nr:sulfatase [Sedimentisphaerales bacterium]
MNIVMLVCDALSAKNLGCYGYDKKTSPQIDKIASKGVRFSNSFCTINSTDPSFTTIFTGKYPLSHGLRNHAHKLTEEEKSYISNMKFLPEILKEHDYYTIGLDWLGKWHKRGYDFYGDENIAEVASKSAEKVGEDSSFQKPIKSVGQTEGGIFSKFLSYFPSLPGRGNWYYHLPDRCRPTVRSMSRWWNAKSKGSFSHKRRPALSDSAGLSDLAIHYIKQYKDQKNFMIFVHYWDNHIPYTAPRSVVKSFLRNYEYPQEKTSSVLSELSGTGAANIIHKSTRGKTPKTLGEIMAYYDASIKYVDGNIGRIYKTVEELNLLDDTLFIITADHGESMGGHDIYFDHHGLYEPQVRVPLIMSHGNLPKGKVYDEMVQHFDIFPTILDMAGINREAMEIDGESLLKLVRGEDWGRRFVYAEEHCGQKKRMIRDEKFKFIMSLDDEKCAYCERYHSKGDEFYDLEADPDEENNIISDPGHEKYKEHLEEFIHNLKKPEKGKVVEFDDEEEINKRLKALGYI